MILGPAPDPVAPLRGDLGIKCATASRPNAFAGKTEKSRQLVEYIWVPNLPVRLTLLLFTRKKTYQSIVDLLPEFMARFPEDIWD
jgi:hypothetical protein